MKILYKSYEDVKELELATAKKRIEIENDNTLHMSKLQYEKEFSIYLEIWEALSDTAKDCILISKISEYQKAKGFKKESFDKYLKFTNLHSKYEPFYNQKFSPRLNQLNYDISDLHLFFNKDIENKFKMDDDERKQYYKQELDQIFDNLKEFKNDLKDYLLCYRIN